MSQLPSALKCALCSLLLATAAFAQYSDPLPQRGVYPNGSYSFDKLETINTQNGILTYTIPITSLPLGRAGLTLPVNLVYSSALADTAPYSFMQDSIPEQSGTASSSPYGGWHFNGFSYGINLTAVPVSNCSESVIPPFQLSVIMPDGSHHVLELAGQADVWGNGFFWYNPGTGVNPCNTSETLPSPLLYYTTDGSYIRVLVTTSASDQPSYAIYLPNGSVYSYGPPVNGVSTAYYTDKNGNKVTITKDSANDKTTLTDDLGRTITLQTQGTTQTVTQAGFNGATLTWTLSGFSGQTINAVCTTPGPQGCGAYVASEPTTLQVPASSGTIQYTFGYDSQTGELNSVTLPSGANTSYQYNLVAQTPQGQSLFSTGYMVTQKTVTWRDPADGSQRSDISKYDYSSIWFGGQCSGYCSKMTAPDNGVTTTTFYGGTAAVGNLLGPLVTKVVRPDGSGAEYTYGENPVSNEKPISSGGTVSTNEYVATKATIVGQNGSPAIASVENITIDLNGNTKIDSISDWVSYASLPHDSSGHLTSYGGGTILQTVTNTYNNPVPNATGAQPATNANAYWSASAPNLRSLLAFTSSTGAGTGSAAQYTYDANNNLTNELHWDSVKSGSTTVPQAGNLSAGNSTLTIWTYDSYGNLSQVVDPRGYTTGYAPDSNNLYHAWKYEAQGTSVQRTFNYQTDFSTGLLTVEDDTDNQAVTYHSYDSMGRPTGTVVGPRTIGTSYDDVARTVTVTTLQDAASNVSLKSVTTYDPLYRVALTQQMESPSDISGIKVQMRYLYSGNNSFKLISNPYRSTSDTTMGWTVLTYDQEGRQSSSQTFSGGTPPSPWGSGGGSTTGTVTTAYATPTAQSTRVTDQAGVQRDSTVDGMGRLVSVTEYPGSGSYATTYGYDVLGDLTQVNQQSQTRTFAYSSLQRLIGSNNPETPSPGLGCSGVTGVYANCYTYDPNGNLLSKLDNRGVGVSYTYDPLNRMLTKNYINSPGTTNIAAVTYSYDNPNVSNSKGRLTSVSTLTGDTSTTNYLGYDAVGDVLSSSQVTAGYTYKFTYVYNAAGALGCETYPSGKTVVTWYDGANRPAQVAAASCPSSFSTLPSGTPAYVSGSYPSGTAISYATNGAPTNYYYGNKLTHSASYNSRLQLGSYTDMVNNCACDQLLNVTLTWPTASGANNGNLRSAVYNNGGPGYQTFLTFSDTFSYDGVNRLLTATDQVTSNGVTTSGWSRSFGYDSYGNMTPSGSPAPPAMSFNANNQLVGQSYDQAGNLLQANGNTLVVDYEGRVSAETDGVTQAVETYVYDGNGQRVEKYNSGTKTVFVYDAFGKLVADYSATVQTPACVTCYVSSDHLGTARLITDGAANVVARHDYLPFGEEVQANAYGRDSHWGPYNDVINQKFTAKERDSESGLDYFETRYYGSALGRFTSPDELFADQSQEDPQSWNMYAYVRNNPLRFTDPDGQKCVDGKDENGGACFTATGTAKADLSPFEELLLRSLLNSLTTTVQVGQQAQNLAQSTWDWFKQPRNPLCMAGYAGAGATIGGFAGGGVGALGFAGGPVGLATTPTFSAGGAALGGGIGGLGGLIACSSGTGQGGSSGEGTGGSQAPLKKLHSDSTLSKTSLEFWRKKSTQEIVDSLRPGNPEALRVKTNGTIMNGNTRITVLQERGFDVNSLPRELH